MKQQTLSGAWELEITGESPFSGEKIPAAVPGSVYATLLGEGKMPDPYWRDNELEALKLMDHDFVYKRVFDLEYPKAGKLLLVCEGLDTICRLELNGRLIGSANNMHRVWEYDITNIALPEGNELTVTFTSPTRYIAERHSELFVDGSSEAMRGFPQIRKAHCMFGWDWGPRLPDAGIWREISIAYIDDVRLDSVYISQNHRDTSAVELSFDFQCSGSLCEDDFDVEITLTSPGGFVTHSTGGPVVITDPQLWWPNGYGAQPLYTVRAALKDGGREVDSWERRIGLRTMSVSREIDEWGESFAHRVNGVDIFAMGADYIPQDNILARVTDEKIRRLLEDCAAANFNAIRVWGGGYYPGDRFYDICDELGLLVWQDFMFSCAIYELTPLFEANIRAELADNIRRLRHHASLGLWCGNNELEWQQGDGSFKATPKQKADYIRMFEYIFPQVVEEHDPQAFYWPASPSSGGGFDEPNDENRGDAHYWDVWHGFKPFSEYRKFFFRYASEFGFQSFPCLKTVRAFTVPEDRNIFSRVMEMHQRNVYANGKIMAYMSTAFRYPTDFDHLLYASQLMQADAIRCGVEHWRRNRGRCMGAIYWQVNDIWPVASWASIDYFGRWKALHYYAKRFFAPVMLSCLETGEMTERPSCVLQPEPIRKAARLALANETMGAVSGTVRWALRDPSAGVISSGEQSVSADALSSVWLDEMDFTGCDELSNYLSYEFLAGGDAGGDADGDAGGDAGGDVVSSGTSLFCMPKHFEFADPQLQVRRDGDSLVVTAAAYARSVEIYCDDDCDGGSGDGGSNCNSGGSGGGSNAPSASDSSGDSFRGDSGGGEDLLLSDNYFDMNAGSVTVKILRGDPKSIKARSVYDLGR